jgi:hypothetical protein
MAPHVRARLLAFVPLVVLASSACGGGAEDLDSGGIHVLVSASSDGGGADAGIVGKVRLIGKCLGIGNEVAFWPHGTKVVSDDPLTIDVPGEGEVTIGDTVSGAGATHSSGRPEVDTSVPDTPIPDACPSGTWVDYRPE